MIKRNLNLDEISKYWRYHFLNNADSTKRIDNYAKVTVGASTY